MDSLLGDTSLLGDMSILDSDTNRTPASKKIREALFRRCRGRCENPYCESPYRNFRGPKDMEAGHKTPVVRNGRTVLGNLVALCRDCNDRMKTMTWAIFLRKEAEER